MKITELITKLQIQLELHGDVETKVDIDGLDCDPDVEWNQRKGLVYLW